MIFHPFLFVAKIFATKKIAIWETLSNSELSLMASILLTERKHIVINMQSVTSIQNFASFCRQNHSHQYHFQCPQEIDEARLRHQNWSLWNRRPILQTMGSRKGIRYNFKSKYWDIQGFFRIFTKEYFPCCEVSQPTYTNSLSVRCKTLSRPPQDIATGGANLLHPISAPVR